MEAFGSKQTPGLALVSICEIDVTSFSEDGRGVKKIRGGSRGRQTSHATNVKMANLIKVLNIRPINSPVIFIMQRHLIIVQYLLSCSASN